MKSNSNKIAQEIQEPPKFAIKFSNVIFISGILCSFLFVIYMIYKLYNPIHDNYYYFILILIGGISAALFSFGLKLKDSMKVNLSILITIASISLYIFEIYLEFSENPKIQYKIAKKMGVSYDTRTILEVLKDLNNAGVKAYLNVLPFFLQTQMV